MPVTDGRVQFQDSQANQVEVSVPSFVYKTIIEFPFDIQKNDDGSYSSYDHGAGAETYDIRRCACRFMLTAAQQNTFNTMMKDDDVNTRTGRAFDMTLRMNTGSGFFPFGPDKGDVGDFTVAMVIKRHATIGEAPYKYFVMDVEMIHTGTYPAYSLPAEVSEGSFTIGTITNNRFPPGWFEPKIEYGYSATIEQDSTVQWIDRREQADWYTTNFEMFSNESKAAKVLEYITGTSREASFTIAAPADFYAFGRDVGNGTFNVKLIQNKIIISHLKHNMFKYAMQLSYESTV